MLMSCVDRPSKEEINTDEDMSDILVRLQNKRMAEIKEIVQIIDPNNNNSVSYSYDKFIEIYDNYGLGGFLFWW